MKGIAEKMGDTPQALMNAPRLMPSLQYVWEGFNVLSSGRSHISTMVGVIPGAISFEAIDRYANRFDIEGEDFDEFLHLIHVLDDEYIKTITGKITKQ